MWTTIRSVKSIWFDPVADDVILRYNYKSLKSPRFLLSIEGEIWGDLFSNNQYKSIGRYTYGPPMAVAPINMVRRVVEYAVSAIPREKISLGIPNYGYDWPLPYVRGTTKAESIDNLLAVRRAIDFGSEIQFDETAQSPYYHYWQYGIQHEVWYEDARSINAKFDLIKEFGLSGAGYWQLMDFFRANWLLMEERFLIERK